MNPSDLIHFCPPSRLLIEAGARARLPTLLHHLGYRCGVLVTDEFFARQTSWVTEYVEAAAAYGIDTLVYAGGLPDPTTALCDEATRRLRAQLDNRVLDHVIALGGGSNIDLAKALCLTLVSGQPVREFVDGIPAGLHPLPLVAMPTTAGTGSEATPGAILVDPDNATKVAVMDNRLRPIIALIDPELTYTCPPRVTADAGVDALTHAVESFLTLDSSQFDRAGHADPGYSGRSSLTMLFAREAISLCARFLERAYRDGSDIEARHGMAYASIYAALSYGSAGLNAVHGIAYAVAGLTHQSHGSTNAVMLPYVLDELHGVRQRELAEIARLFGVNAPSPVEAAVRLPATIRELISRLGIPITLQGFGVSRSQLLRLTVDGLAVTRLAKAFPVLDAASAYASIVNNAWTGTLRG
ncbi:alcohol dehydrogenase [Pandoraea thiooxydans]|uniref:Alcohol dehydrogenase n=1 Tax=Pandoraea thiooxydans TaxID=445709 RepID=A0A0G3EMZ3_9BURK|nr:iron-containing alcohol dehydrogenase [Pandoraea thiooxydans]AKJ68365.1 alcohol dehydrogenase [Pandoraea thiooxydans]APR95708.1 alcohol dehydrogenase [Pandoraea thiooxydans]